MFLQNELSSWM